MVGGLKSCAKIISMITPSIPAQSAGKFGVGVAPLVSAAMAVTRVFVLIVGQKKPSNFRLTFNLGCTDLRNQERAPFFVFSRKYQGR
jgi:hypothetical protein